MQARDYEYNTIRLAHRLSFDLVELGCLRKPI